MYKTFVEEEDSEYSSRVHSCSLLQPLMAVLDKHSSSLFKYLKLEKTVLEYVHKHE